MQTSPMYFHVSKSSSNSKVGRMLVTTTSDNTCPPTCAHKLRGTCYASFSFLGLHWRKVSAGARSQGFEHVLDMVRQLPKGALFRWNQAGDLPGIGQDIDASMLERLVDANNGKRGFTYTHKYNTLKHKKLIEDANEKGFTINISAEDIEQAVKINKVSSAPVVVTVPHDYRKDTHTVDGEVIVTCPAEYKDVQCTDCKMCAIPDRKTIIAFHAHGSRKEKY